MMVSQNDHLQLRREVLLIKTELVELENSQARVLNQLARRPSVEHLDDSSREAYAGSIRHDVNTKYESPPHLWPRVQSETPTLRRKPTASCIAVGVVGNTAVDELSQADALEEQTLHSAEWPLTNNITSSPLVPLNGHLTRHVSIKRMDSTTIPEGKRRQKGGGHVKQSISCGSTSAFHGSFEQPRSAPEVPSKDTNETKNTSLMQKNSVFWPAQPLSDNRSSRARSKTVNDAGYDWRRLEYTQLQRAPSLNMVAPSSRNGTAAPHMVARKPVQNVRTLHASMNKDLPPVKEIAMSSPSGSHSQTHAPYLDDLLHDLTIANQL